MLGQAKPKKTDEQIKQERNKWLDDMLKKSAKLKALISNNKSGWVEFIELLDDYIDKCKKRKVITALDMATDKELYELKLLDHEVFILSWVRRMPAQFINNIDEEVKRNEE